MQPTGISSGLIRILPSLSPDLLADLLTPGQVLDADVVSVFQDRAILSFGRGVRLEVALQAPLQEGQRVRVQVQQAQPGAGAPAAPPQTAAAPKGAAQPAPQAPVFYPRPNLVAPALPAAASADVPAPAAPEGEAAPQATAAPQAPEAAGQPPVVQQQPATEGAPAPAPAQPQAPQAQQPAPAAIQPQPAAAEAAAPQPQPQQQPAGTPAQPAAAQPQTAPEQPSTPPAAGTTTTVSEFLTRQGAGLSTGPQQLLRPVILTQAGAAPAPPAEAQPQLQAAARQPAAPASPASQTSPPTPGAAPPVVLKVIATLPPRDPTRPAGPGPTAAPAPAPDQPAATAAAKAAGAAAAVREALTTPGQPAPVSNQPPAQQPGAPQVFWLPVPLPDGKQGWAQLHIQEDESPRARGAKGGPAHEVRIWWETPSLGPVQVTLDAVSDKLAALFTAVAPESKGALEPLLPELQRRLSQVGFPEARVGCRTAAPGEAVEPARAQGASRLDKRL